MIPGISLVELISLVSIYGVAAIIFAESGLLIGFFLPGDSLLFTTGFLMSTGVIHANLYWSILLFFVAAVAGDSVGYAFGRRSGPFLFKKPNARIFKQEYVQRAQEFYEKHGGKTIVLARFIPIIRTFAPIVAGAAKMPYPKFLSYNLLGGFLWTAGITSLGYFLGQWFHSIGIEIDTVILPLVALIILISVAPPLIHILKDKKNRDTLIAAIKRQFRSLTGRNN